MIISRILFLSTYNTTMDFKKLIDEHSLADNVAYVCCLLNPCGVPILNPVATPTPPRPVARIRRGLASSNRRAGSDRHLEAHLQRCKNLLRPGTCFFIFDSSYLQPSMPASNPFPAVGRCARFSAQLPVNTRPGK